MMRIPAAVLFIICLLLQATLSCDAGAQSVTFVQITDPHLFDSARKINTMGGYEAYLDNGGSLAWSILQINKLVSSGKQVDFVLVTGDFGLEETDCANNAKNTNPSRELVDCTKAAETMAIFFRALLVKRVFLVPGNNDVPDEDPKKLAVYDVFVKDLAAKLKSLQGLSSTFSPPAVVDLRNQKDNVNGICIIGLDSSTFKNTKAKPGDLAATNFSEQKTILTTVYQETQSCQPSIIVTHIPNLEDPFRGDGIKRAWNLEPKLMETWNSIIKQPHVLAVFAGHFHDSRRNIYMHDFSWASQPPNQLEADKTWVAPPLAVKLQSTAKPQARGLLMATVTAAGKITAQPTWFGLTDPADQTDKRSDLSEATSYELAEEYDKASAAYKNALSSKDDWTRTQAEAGFQRTVKLATEHSWKTATLVRFFLRWWRDLLLGFFGLVVAALALRRGVTRVLHAGVRGLIGTPEIMIFRPQKGHEGAPIEEFTAQLLLALDDIEATLGPLSQPSYLTFHNPTATVAAPGTGEELPDLKLSGVELKTLVAWIFAARNLVRRRITIEVWGSTARTQVFAIQRFGWAEETRWAAPQPGSTADIQEAAKQLAYDILGQEYIRR